MTTARSLRAHLSVETLESRLMLDAKLPVLTPPTTLTVQTSTLQAAPMHVDYGTGLPAPGAAAAPGASPAATTIYSVVTIRNQTANRINYSLQWPGSSAQSFYVDPNSSRIHWCTSQNVAPTISYDWSFAAGYQGQSYNLTSRDLAGRQPSLNSDGMQYYFTRNSANTGLNFFADVTLNKTALSQYRAGVTSSGSFPRLLTNFEVQAAPTNVYNCIAWSLGYTDRWVNPITSTGANKLAGMDSLYAQKGYSRLSTLDYSLRAGYQKVVVYATVVNGVIKEVTHAAIQSSDGAWTSKLGANARIKHLYVDDIAGGLYGTPVAVYMRKI